jgi:hypothetical protein
VTFVFFFFFFSFPLSSFLFFFFGGGGGGGIVKNSFESFFGVMSTVLAHGDYLWSI